MRLFGAGLRPIFSRRFLIVLAGIVAANALYGIAVALNPLLIYLSVVFLLVYGFSLLLVDSADAADEKKRPVRRGTFVSLLVILLVSLALNSIGSTWAFPFLAHPDEYSVAEKAATMTEHRSLNADNYTHPNDISIYASAILYPVVNRAISGERFAESFAKDKMPFYLTSRLVSAVSGVLLTAAAYIVGSMTAPAVGIIAAAIFAIFPPFVENAHYATPDVLVTALLMFVLFYCVRFLRNGRTRDLFLALVFSSLSVAEKYTALLTLPLLLAVVIFREADSLSAVFTVRPRIPLQERKTAVVFCLIAVVFVAAGVYALRNPDVYNGSRAYITSVLHRPLAPDFGDRIRTISKMVIVAGLLLGVLGLFLRFLSRETYPGAAFVIVGAPIVTFLVTPFQFIDVGHALYTFSHEARNTALGADGLGYLGNLLFYAGDYVSVAGILSLLFMAIGIVFVFRERWLLPVLFSFFTWICLSVSGLHWARWGLPMYAGPLLLVSYGLYRSWLVLMARIGRGGTLALLVVLCAVPAASLTLTSVATTYQFALKDTRVAASLWSQEHGVTAQNTIYDGYTPFQPGSPGTIDFPGPADPRYVAVSSYMYDRYLSEKDRYRSQAVMYARIFTLPLVASFAPVKDDVSSSFELGNVAAQVRFLKRLDGSNGPVYRGPTILIFRKTE